MKAPIIMINASNIKYYIDAYTMSKIVFDYLTVVPKSPAEATKRYNYQKLLRGAVNGTNGLKPKRTILNICKQIAGDHEYCENLIRKNGRVPAMNAIFDWNTSFTEKEAPMWGNYDENGKINLEEAIGYMLFNKMKPYLIDNKKNMFYDRCVNK